MSESLPKLKVGSRLSRENTKEEKKAMKKKRRKRKIKAKVEELKRDLAEERKAKGSAEQKCRKYIGMSRTYWERWRWEVRMRREATVSERTTKASSTTTTKVLIPNIDPHMLKDPVVNGEAKECFVGRGSFGIVRLQIYRDIKVAVKELLPRTLIDDVTKEAQILASLSHPYLPFLFGISINETPYRIVMQFHAISELKSITLYQELSHRTLDLPLDWALLFGAQLLEAVRYLHMEVDILHNDITYNNILITQDKDYHIVLIDFGKATKLSQAKFYHLTEAEQQEYLLYYPHIAPEVIFGRYKQSVYSDMFSVGLVLHHITDRCSFSAISVKRALVEFVQKCRSLNQFERPKSTEALKFFESLS